MFIWGERHNLAPEPAQSATLGAMRGRLERWMKATDDPLLKGRVPAPAGAVANNPDGLSPRHCWNWTEGLSLVSAPRQV